MLRDQARLVERLRDRLDLLTLNDSRARRTLPIVSTVITPARPLARRTHKRPFSPRRGGVNVRRR